MILNLFKLIKTIKQKSQLIVSFIDLFCYTPLSENFLNPLTIHRTKTTAAINVQIVINSTSIYSLLSIIRISYHPLLFSYS